MGFLPKSKRLKKEEKKKKKKRKKRRRRRRRREKKIKAPSKGREEQTTPRFYPPFPFPSLFLKKEVKPEQFLEIIKTLGYLSHTQKFGFGQSTQTFWNASLKLVNQKKGGNKP